MPPAPIGLALFQALSFMELRRPTYSRQRFKPNEQFFLIPQLQTAHCCLDKQCITGEYPAVLDRLLADLT